MKKKVRNITVAQQEFVYWYAGGGAFDLFISPEMAKELKVVITFTFPAPKSVGATFWSFYQIKAIKVKEVVYLKVAEPQFVAMLLVYLLENYQELISKKGTQKLNGNELLAEIGYQDLAADWIQEL